MIEKVQQRAIRMCSGLRGQKYEEKLREIGLDSLEVRRKKCDMIQVWKIVHNHDNLRESDFFERMHIGAQRFTRASDNQFNLRPSYANLDPRRNFFTNRVITSWNSLPGEIKSARTISNFKLDDHFLH